MSVKEQMESRIESHFKPAVLKIIDESPNHARAGSSSHFRILIVSSAFEGLNSVQRHRRVFQAIGSEIMNKVHAVSQQTYTPNEWNKEGVLRESAPCQHKKQ